MRKSAEAFKTISEVAEDLKVPKHVLRFWEIKFPHIRPMKRGGGRRYYRPEDVELLCGIRALLHADGYTIKGVQKILKEHGADYAKAYGRGEAVNNHELLGKSGPTSKNPATKTRATAKSGRKPSAAAAKAEASQAALTGIITELEALRTDLSSALSKKKAPARTKRTSTAA